MEAISIAATFAAVLAAVATANTAAAAPPPGFVDASTFGYDAGDATAALQAAIDTGSNVYVPDTGSPWVVRPITLSCSNQEILFESGVVVAAKPGAFQAVGDALFTASGKSNIKLTGYGATLRMRKADYQQAPYEPAEWRHGINLLDVSGIEIRGLTIADTGGDGIYVGTNSETGYSQDVTIADVALNNNHRQGISVISVKNMLVDNAVILNTRGTAPEAGIDFEVNFQTQRLANVKVRNSIIQANHTWGILFAGHSELPEPITVDIENVTILANEADGIRLYNPLPGVTVRDSLIVGNADFGVRGTPETEALLEGEQQHTGPARNMVEYSALWNNGQGTHAGWVALGDGTVSDVEPIFYSTDARSPYFLYLDPSNAAGILNGAQDGGYLGARPAYVAPEPGAASLVLIGGWGLAARRQHD
jgi:hypothetical protein